jgi:predicted HicB family RNase H-like nuclease
MPEEAETRLYVRVSPERKLTYEKAAQKQELSTSEWIRTVLDDAADAILTSKPKRE